MTSGGLLCNRDSFPPFRKLPDIMEIDPEYLDISTGQYALHWCFLAEIVADGSLFRPTFQVRDRDGKLTMVALYFDNGTPFDCRDYVVGNTICIMYAFQKIFLDGRPGVRVEEPRFIQAIRCPLQTLLDVGTSSAVNPNACKVCGIPANQKCSKCGTKYCCRECQAADWSSGSHKRECPAVKLVRKWNSFSWDEFNGFQV